MIRTQSLVAALALGAACASAQNVVTPAGAPPGPAPGSGVWLVTPEEAQRFRGEDAFNALAALRPRAAVPVIEIVRPELVGDLKVKAPFPITVVFRGQADAAIDPRTFKVMYGALKIDITSRLTGFTQVTREGFTLDQANIPAGRHRLTLQVMDEKQRLAERELRLVVE